MTLGCDRKIYITGLKQMKVDLVDARKGKQGHSTPYRRIVFTNQ